MQLFNLKLLSEFAGTGIATDRYQLIDIFRGVAIVLMMVYHFNYDLVYFALADFDFNHDIVWLGFRTLILSLFLFLVGVSLQIAALRGLRTVRYLRRLAYVFFSALLVTAGSYFMFPQSLIFFGVLHFIVVASLIGLLFVRWYWFNLVLGVALILLAMMVKSPFFDQPSWQWFGLMTHKPVTEDYVPLLPWFGVVLIGMFVGRMIQGRYSESLSNYSQPHFLARLLAFGGRHSLLIYMLHQPIFLGILYLLFGFV